MRRFFRFFLVTLAVVLGMTAVVALHHAWPGWQGRRLLVAAEKLHQERDAQAALERYERALELAREHGSTALEIRALLGSAEVLYASGGTLRPARERLERALELAREHGEERLEAAALGALGVYYWWYERRRERPLPEFYRPALEIYERLGDERGIAAIRARIGVVHLAAADYEAAADELEASFELYRKRGDEAGLGQVHAYLGALHAGLENAPRAHRHYRRALEIAHRRGDLREAARVEALIADLHLRRGEYESAVTLLDGLIAAEKEPSIAVRNHLLSRGHAELHLGRARAAAASYGRALEIDAGLPGDDPPFRARAATMLAHAHMQTGELARAAAALERAEAVPIAAKGWGETVLHTLARADLAALRGAPSEALAHLLAAAEIEHQTFGAARSHFFQSQYRQVFERLFALLLDGTVSRQRAHELTFRFLEQMRYRSFRGLVTRAAADPGTSGRPQRPPSAAESTALERLESLGQRLAAGHDATLWEELRQAYGDYEDAVLRAELARERYRRVAGARPVTLAEARAALGPETALVEYVVAAGRVFALAVTRHGVESAVSPLAAEALAAKVKLFRYQVERGDDGWRRLARELGEALVAPLAKTGALDGIQAIVVVPMAFLHDLPFTALELDGRLLAERYVSSRSASATAWLRGGPTPPRAQRRIVAFGLAESPAPSLPPLAWAVREAEAVADVTGGRAWTGDGASEARLKRVVSAKHEAADALWIHVAAHGTVAPGIPLHSALLLAPGQGEDGRLSVREILELEIRAEIVTLSACQTGLSRGAARDSADLALEVDRLGPALAFRHAGARHVLATLVPVNDAATAVFMADFYQRLLTVPPAEALAEARRQRIADQMPPRFWAPFVLIGSDSGIP